MDNAATTEHDMNSNDTTALLTALASLDAPIDAVVAALPAELRAAMDERLCSYDLESHSWDGAKAVRNALDAAADADAG